jgi:hypothetical protein
MRCSMSVEYVMLLTGSGGTKSLGVIRAEGGFSAAAAHVQHENSWASARELCSTRHRLRVVL